MAFKCVNELDKFMFQDAEVKKMELNPGLMTMVLLGVAAKHNNQSNDTLTSFQISGNYKIFIRRRKVL